MSQATINWGSVINTNTHSEHVEWSYLQEFSTIRVIF